MDKSILLPFLFFVLLLFFNCGKVMVVHANQVTWCVAKPSSDDRSLQKNIDYACKYVDCSVINPDGACFYPDTLLSRASVAMNLYYQQMGRISINCNFRNSGLVTLTNPSFGSCNYE